MFENHMRVIAKPRETAKGWTSHGCALQTEQVSELDPPPEALLIERLRNEARPKLSIRAAAEAAGISDARWRQIAKGHNQASKDVRVPARAPAGTLARMAKIVGATPEQLREVGREDAADELEALNRAVRDMPQQSRPGQQMTLTEGLSARLEWLNRLANPTPTSHDTHFERAERLLLHSHESVRVGDYLGAINGLEGVQSTVELLIDRITDDATETHQKGAHRADQPQPSADPSAEPDAQTEDDKVEEVESGLSAAGATESRCDRDHSDTDSQANPGDDQSVSGTPESKAANARTSARNSLGRQTPTGEAADRTIETPR